MANEIKEWIADIRKFLAERSKANEQKRKNNGFHGLVCLMKVNIPREYGLYVLPS